MNGLIRWKLIKQAGYAKPAAHPDLQPEEEALLLDELFKELLRSTIIETRSEDFKEKLTRLAEEATGQFPSFRLWCRTGLIRRIWRRPISASIAACSMCHGAYRN